MSLKQFLILSIFFGSHQALSIDLPNPGRTLAAGLGFGEDAEAEGLCSAEDKEEFAKIVAEMAACPCFGVKPAVQKSYDRFLEACTKSQEAMDVAQAAGVDMGGVESKNAANTFSSEDVAQQKQAAKKMKEHIKLLEETKQLLDDAKAEADDAEGKLKICPDPIGKLMDGPAKLKEIIDRVLDKVEKSIESAEGLVEAISGAAEATESGYAEEPPPEETEQPTGDGEEDPAGDDENPEDDASSGPDWAAPQDSLMEWVQPEQAPDWISPGVE